MRSLVITVFSFLSVYGFAQVDTKIEFKDVEKEIPIESTEVFTVVEIQAEFPGGITKLNEFISANLRYPKKAKRKKIEGTVYVEFIIQKDGTVTDPKVIKGISKECDAEALRIAQIMPNWRPGKQRGIAVKARFVYPIKFKIDNEKK